MKKQEFIFKIIKILKKKKQKTTILMINLKKINVIHNENEKEEIKKKIRKNREKL